MSNLPEHIEEIIIALALSKGRLFLTKEQACHYLKCAPKNFEDFYVKTNLLHKLYPGGRKSAHYSIYEVLEAPIVLLKAELEEEKEYKPKTIDELIDETNREWDMKEEFLGVSIK